MRSVLVLSALVCLEACDAADSAATETEEPLCGGAEECDVEVVDAAAECGENEVPSLTATASGTDVYVEHLDAAYGCCPSLLVTATLSVERESIYLDYDLSEDECTCSCPLDLGYRLTDVPFGDWTLVVDGVDDVQVMVRAD